MLIRYPGSKAKIRGLISNYFPDTIAGPLYSHALMVRVYCEPFMGGGAMAWDALDKLFTTVQRVVVNDLDPGIAALWQSVRDAPDELIQRIVKFKPAPEAFLLFKAEDGRIDLDPLERGFRKLALHQMSFSGLGFMSGSMLGGRNQRSEYNVSCRWNPLRLSEKIQDWHDLMRSHEAFEILCADFELVLARLPLESFAYLDPPYYKQGSALYKYSMRHEDHERLAGLLRTAEYEWVLSYDDHTEIRNLYRWATIKEIKMTPTMARAKGERRKNNEIVILPRE